MGRRLLVACACALVWCGAAQADPWTKTDQRLTMSDGVQLATSLYEPATAAPVGGWPAIIMFHGLGGDRRSMNTIAEQVFAQQGYAVLTFDARGHGESGGLSSIDGPREVQDTRELFTWLTSKPEIDRAHVGAWGISLGGGGVWRAMVDGVPFAASEVVESWVDLLSALAPNGLSKSGAVFAFLNSLPPDRFDPSVLAMKDDALNSRLSNAVLDFVAQRSAVSTVRRIETPTLVFQGRRDFAFPLDQGITAYKLLGGPKRLYIGDFGHPPSTFPGPDVAAVFAEGTSWFNRFLKGIAGIAETPVQVAPDPWRSTAHSYDGLPPVTTVRTSTAKLGKTFDARGKLVATFALPPRLLETFGAPVVTVTASTKTEAKQLVAVLEAAKGSTANVVSEGGTLLPTASKAWTLSFRLISDATLIPRGSKLRLTLSWTSTAQNTANLLYLTGVPDGSSLTVKSAYVTLPVLKNPISR